MKEKNIIYLACMYDQKTYKKVYINEKKPIQAANKYHTLMCEGLVANNISLNTICCVPVNRRFSKKIILKLNRTEVNDVSYSYLPIINIPVIKHIFLFLSSFFRMIRFNKKNILIYDGLIISAAYGAMLAAKLRGIRSIALLTDLPEYMAINGNQMGRKINDFLIDKSDGYVFLTEQMNSKINQSKKPYIVLEGHVDSKMSAINRSWEECNLKTVLYAGGLEEHYGINELCKAFINIHKENEELHIYGDGSFKKQLEDICIKHPYIKYYGVVPVEEVVKEELKATLLVNPRSPEGEFTKYSFPSKTMEYMVTGTPVAMCKLPGMPDEYCEYLYLFESGSYMVIQKKLREILDLPVDSLREHGSRARKFVLHKKNNIQQAKKIINFIEKNFSIELSCMIK